jgi:hypothetical protein
MPSFSIFIGPAIVFFAGILDARRHSYWGLALCVAVLLMFEARMAFGISRGEEYAGEGLVFGFVCLLVTLFIYGFIRSMVALVNWLER